MESKTNTAAGYPACSAGSQPRPEAPAFFSLGFVIFAVLVVGGAAVGGSLESGKLTFNQFFAHKAAPVAPVAPAAPAPTLKAGAFVVTSISLGQPSIAIINGASHVEGDPLVAPGVTGWKVSRIVDGAVWLQNGSASVPVPLTMAGLRPLDDNLHPLN